MSLSGSPPSRLNSYSVRNRRRGVTRLSKSETQNPLRYHLAKQFGLSEILSYQNPNRPRIMRGQVAASESGKNRPEPSSDAIGVGHRLKQRRAQLIEEQPFFARICNVV